MAFISLGTITVDSVSGPRDYEIWSATDPEESWASTQTQYFPDYSGPPPSNLESVVKARAEAQADQEKRM